MATLDHDPELELEAPDGAPLLPGGEPDADVLPPTDSAVPWHRRTPIRAVLALALTLAPISACVWYFFHRTDFGPYDPPCPSLLRPPPAVVAPALFCPTQYLPLLQLDGDRSQPQPLRMHWLTEDAPYSQQRVRDWIASDDLFASDPAAFGSRERARGLQGTPPARRLFDILLLNTELEWLDLRLQELWHVVDVFVLVESRETFSGARKPLAFDETAARRYHPEWRRKVRHVVLDAQPPETVRVSWNREAYQRTYPLTHERLASYGVRTGDLIMVNDIDELPRANVLHQLKQCGGWEELGQRKGHIALGADYAQYGFEFVSPDSFWLHPNLAVYSPDLDLTEEALRWYSHTDRLGNAAAIVPVVFEGAWHCSSCFATLAAYVDKLKAFSHTEFNTPEMTDQEALREKIRREEDLFSTNRRPRRDLLLKAMPTTLTQHPRCYAHLLDRAVGIEPGQGNWWQPEGNR